MRKMLFVLAFIFSVGNLLAQTSRSNAIGWRNGVLTTYCEEYDLMLDNNKQWVLPWNSNRKSVKNALIRDGFKIEETDSTILWKYEDFIKFEIQFTEDSKIKNIGMIIILKPINGIQIADALLTKLESVYREKGKIRDNDGSATSYVWHNTSCDKSVVTMLYSSLVNKDTYVITQYSSQLQ
jgi:hypothetical protein